MTPKRKAIETKVIETFRILDKSGLNEKKYKDFFKSLSDEKFSKWIKEFLKDEDANFFLEVLPYESEPDLKTIKKAADYLNCPIEEKVTFHHLGGIETKEKVPVGYIFVKRHEELLAKKNSMTEGINQRSFKTGQVTGNSKAARISDMDNYALQTIGAESILKELLGPRADDMNAKLQLYEKIGSEGFVYQNEIKSNPKEKISLNTSNTLLLGAGIRTDLVNSTLLLPITNDD